MKLMHDEMQRMRDRIYIVNRSLDDLSALLHESLKATNKLVRDVDDIRITIDHGIKEPAINDSHQTNNGVICATEFPALHKLTEKPSGHTLICSNCKNYRLVNEVEVCQRKKTDMFTTSVRMLNTDCRIERKSPDGCGPDGRYFMGQDGKYFVQK